MPPPAPTLDPPARSDVAGRAGWVWKLPLALLFLTLVVWLGRHYGHRLPELEQWIAGHGPVGWAVFVGLTVAATSLFVPDSVFAVAAGLLFGLAGGTALMAVAALLTASVNFVVSRRLLHGLVRRWLERQPRLAALERAVNREGLRFQFLLRLTPLSPVAVSYMLGVTSTRFRVFLPACLGLIPGLFVEVYFGHVAKHVARAADQPADHLHLHFLLSVAGLLLCLALFAYVTRLARRALVESEAAATAPAAPPP